MTFWFILKKNSGKQKSNIFRVEIKIVRDAYHEKNFAFDNIYMVLSYHPHLLKSKVVESGIIFPNAEVNKPTFFVLRNVIFTLFTAIKAKCLLNRHIPCFCSDTIYGKSIKKNHKKSHF